jgi:ABC-type antimicrobial peptide transport system permease subunit
MALGARPGDVARRILREALEVVAWGTAVGMLLAIGLGLAARGAFFGVVPYDPPTLGLATLSLLIVAVLAAWIPARRAASLDPMISLRAE